MEALKSTYSALLEWARQLPTPVPSVLRDSEDINELRASVFSSVK